MKLQAQPYRKGAREPNPALGAMMAGRSAAAPGAALVAAMSPVSQANAPVSIPSLKTRKQRPPGTVLVPRKPTAILKAASRTVPGLPRL